MTRIDVSTNLRCYALMWLDNYICENSEMKDVYHIITREQYVNWLLVVVELTANYWVTGPWY